jgi:hypothetical protein
MVQPVPPIKLPPGTSLPENKKWMERISPSHFFASFKRVPLTSGLGNGDQ